jgi:hypothetical protein
MGRTRGSKNKNLATPSPLELSLGERVNLVANLMLDKIINDQEKGQPLLKKIEGEARNV